jgi:hypothetical protein
MAGTTVGVLRTVRAAVVGLTAISLALLGHVAAGGPAPAPGPLLLVVLVVLLVSSGLSGKRWTTGPLLAVLLGSQALFHVAFGGAGAHAHGGQHLAAGSATSGHPALLMLVGHTVAALLTALLLRRGEDWLCGVVALLARAWRAARIAAAQPVAAAPGAAWCLARDTSAALGLLEHVVARRGPPAYLRA